MLGGGGAWGSSLPKLQKITVAHSALQAAALTNTSVLYALAPKEVVRSVTAKHSVAFGGGTIATYTVSVGILGSLTKYLGLTNVFQAVGDTVSASALPTAAVPESYVNSTNLVISAVSTVGNLSASTAGSVDIWLETVLLP